MSFVFFLNKLHINLFGNIENHMKESCISFSILLDKDTRWFQIQKYYISFSAKTFFLLIEKLKKIFINAAACCFVSQENFKSYKEGSVA